MPRSAYIRLKLVGRVIWGIIAVSLTIAAILASIFIIIWVLHFILTGEDLIPMRSDGAKRY
jgi:hypothetical protein